MFAGSWRDFVASDARRRDRFDLRRYVREIERASIVYVHNVELRISYMSGNSLTSGLFSHYEVHMNSNHRTVRSFRGSRKAKVIGLNVYSRVRGCVAPTLANIRVHDSEFVPSLDCAAVPTDPFTILVDILDTPTVRRRATPSCRCWRGPHATFTVLR